MFAQEVARRPARRGLGVFGRLQKKAAGGSGSGMRLLTRAPDNEHTLRLATLVERCLLDTLSTDLFPYQVPPAPGAMRTLGGATISRAATKVEEVEGGELCGARLIIFVIGGVTAAEVREARKMGAKYGRQVVVISTALISFAHYIEGISRLRR